MRHLCPLVLALCGAVSVLEAQSSHPQLRQGFWISGSLGVGFYNGFYDFKAPLSAPLDGTHGAS